MSENPLLKEMAPYLDLAVDLYRKMRGEDVEMFAGLKIEGMPEDQEERDSTASLGAVLSVLAVARGIGEVSVKSDDLMEAAGILRVETSIRMFMQMGAPLRRSNETDENGWPAIEILPGFPEWGRAHGIEV